MHPELTPLNDIDDLEQLLRASGDQPLLLFKHSRSCGVSAEALDEVVSHLNVGSQRVRYAIVIVQTHRAVSNAITHRLGVRHETPQVLLVRDGRVVWSASHFRVTADKLEAAIQSHLTDGPTAPSQPRDQLPSPMTTPTGS